MSARALSLPDKAAVAAAEGEKRWRIPQGTGRVGAASGGARGRETRKHSGGGREELGAAMGNEPWVKGVDDAEEEEREVNNRFTVPSKDAEASR